MDLKNIQCTINCTWDVQDNSQIRNLITFGDADDPEERSSFDDEIEHSIDEDNFVQLSKRDDESCMISVVLEDPSLKIVKLSLVCEARMVELYGKCGEYITTENCHLLGVTSERNFYNIQPNIYPTKEVSIKLLKLNGSTWLYGLKLLVRHEAPSSSSYFDYKNVEEILKYSKIPISEKADKAKKFLQNYAKIFTNNPPKPDQQILIKMMEEQYLSQFTPVGGMDKNVFSQYLSNIIPSKKDVENTEIKQYVDKSIQQLEERVQNKISQQIKELETKQNEKLDSIIRLLTLKS